MSTTTPSRSVPVDIQALLPEFDASGQSAAAFARSRGIATWKIYHALSRRSGKLRARRARTPTGAPALLPVHLIESKPTPRPASLELLLAGGHRLLLGPDFDAGLLLRVLEALRSC